MPLRIVQPLLSRSSKLVLELDTAFHKNLDTATTCAEHFCQCVDGVKPPRDAGIAQVQEVRLVVLENEAAPRARGAPSTGRPRRPSQVLEEARGALEMPTRALDALFCTSILLAALGRFTCC